MDIVSTPRGACPWVFSTSVDKVKRLATRIATNLTTCRSILTFFTAQSASLDHGRHRIDWARKVLDIIEEYTQLSAEQLRLGYATPVGEVSRCSCDQIGADSLEARTRACTPGYDWMAKKFRGSGARSPARTQTYNLHCYRDQSVFNIRVQPPATGIPCSGLR